VDNSLNAKKIKTVAFVVLLLSSSIISGQFLFLNGYVSAAKAYNQDNVVRKALSFILSLLTNYEDDKWLVKEHGKASTYWIYNDNVLAYQILSHYGNELKNQTMIEAAEKIRKTIEEKYNISIPKGNGRIEVLFKDKTISYPPYSGTGFQNSPIIDSDMLLGQNLILNPSIEEGTNSSDYWYFSDDTMKKTQWSTEQARTGSKSIKIEVTNQNADWRTQVFQVTPQKNYLLRGYVKGIVEKAEWYFTVRWFNYSKPENKYFIFENNTTIGVGEYADWTQVVLFNMTAPPKAMFADVLFRALGKDATGELYADDFEFSEIKNVGTFIVRNEVKSEIIPDWQKYADLLLLEVINLFNQNNDTYRGLWDNATKIWAGLGMTDEPYRMDKTYQTYKLALFIIASNITGETIPKDGAHAIEILVKRQNPNNGGFTTGYLTETLSDPNATENVETTSLAICALSPDIPWSWPQEPFLPIIILIILLVIIVVVIISIISVVGIRRRKRNPHIYAR